MVGAAFAASAMLTLGAIVARIRGIIGGGQLLAFAHGER